MSDDLVSSFISGMQDLGYSDKSVVELINKALKR